MSKEQLTALEDLLRSGPDLSQGTLEEVRSAYDQMGNITPLPEGRSVRADTADGVPVELGTGPGTNESHVLVFFHGGGYVIGSLASHRGMVGILGQAASAQTVAVDYRLAPENPHPAAVEDGLAVYKWLLTRHSPGAIAFAGDSAGGGLALATLLSARQNGLPMPSSLTLICPFLDMTGSGESVAENAATDLVAKPDMIQWMGGAYLAGADPKAPLASPLFADLQGLPPTLIHGSGSEILLDDGHRLARKLVRAGVEVSARWWPDLPHVWQLFTGMLDEGRDSLEDMGQFINSRFH